MQKIWDLRSLPDEQKSAELAELLHVPPVIGKILFLRNVRSYQEARVFFRPTLEDLHDPFLMSGMETATMRIIDAITSKEKILVYGDYDVDGTCSTSLLYLFFKRMDANVDYYIPNRLKEGYGVSISGIDYAVSTGASLLITVDCGITAVEETAYANSKGLQVIICDHHQPKEVLPDALAVLDPLKPGCEYPFKYLSGAGVAFKLVQGICKRIGKKEYPMEYLDLVALAGAADIVPLVDENRILVKEGLAQINNSPRPGIRALIENARLEPGKMTSGQVVFTIAPRINAVGRMSDAKTAVELLITEDNAKARELASILEEENRQRRKIDEDTLTRAVNMLDSEYGDNIPDTLVLHNNEWHPGVIGIVASRLVEKYYKPTIMLTTIDGVAKGSARSISKFNIYEALKECEDLLLHFGGHEAAAGLAVELDKVDEFRKKFNDIVSGKLNGSDTSPTIDVDAKISFEDLTPKFMRLIEQFAPFGPANMRPTFWLENVTVKDNPRLIKEKHLIMTVAQKGTDKVFDAVGFNMPEYYRRIFKGERVFDLAFTIDIASNYSRSFAQLKIKDIRFPG
ncbi:MAG: single-stranded-DNA-specific exonuclease RecJ [Ignavibacteriaceae bacterium]|nr:single-stranded-DNA-specific exonuclease RecJ [Ignavibacteriaceae bacterium]